MFPHYSEEARLQLGLPDSPVVHFAITRLANNLTPIGQGSPYDDRIVRITALRTASRAVLEFLPWECAVYLFRTQLDLPADSSESEEAFRTVRRNWLRDARVQIAAEGFDSGPAAECMATAYGWNRTPPPPGPKAAVAMPHTVTDEHGRTWHLPTDNDELFDLVNEYGRKHGRPTRAVSGAFSRHKQFDTFRMLLVRGAEGEHINVAFRALALGPMPPVNRPLPQALPGLPTPEERLRRQTEARAKFDEQLVSELRVEAEDLRRRGYVE